MNATALTSPIFGEESLTYDYNGTELEVSEDKANVLATAIDLLDETETKVAAYWEDGVSKVAVFGGMTPFFDLSLISPNSMSNYQVISRMFTWMINDQKTPLEVIVTNNPTAGSSTQIQITVLDSSYKQSWTSMVIGSRNSGIAEDVESSWNLPSYRLASICA